MIWETCTSGAFPQVGGCCQHTLRCFACVGREALIWWWLFTGFDCTAAEKKATEADKKVNESESKLRDLTSQLEALKRQQQQQAPAAIAPVVEEGDNARELRSLLEAEKIAARDGTVCCHVCPTHASSLRRKVLWYSLIRYGICVL